MPHIVYLASSLLCPWTSCGHKIELIDFQLEKLNDPALYAAVMSAWGQNSDFGLIAKCPKCRKFVRFGLSDKEAVADPQTTGLPILPDDWHVHAFIA